MKKLILIIVIPFLAWATLFLIDKIFFIYSIKDNFGTKISKGKEYTYNDLKLAPIKDIRN